MKIATLEVLDVQGSLDAAQQLHRLAHAHFRVATLSIFPSHGHLERVQGCPEPGTLHSRTKLCKRSAGQNGVPATPD
jgi:hypothetical protein